MVALLSLYVSRSSPYFPTTTEKTAAGHLYQLYLAMQQIEDRRTLDHRRRDGACCWIRLDKNLNHAKRNFAVRRFLRFVFGHVKGQTVSR